ncbi:DUF6851 domain-containing protein [Roseivirga pacifica]
MKRFFQLLCLLVFAPSFLQAQSVARQWNEALLHAIRNDFARPTVHARNLFHISAAMYDGWAAYNVTASTYMLGKTMNGQSVPFTGVSFESDLSTKEQQEMTMSYAAYRLLLHRFRFSPGGEELLATFDELMESLGYDINITSDDYATNGPAALGNYIAYKYIEFGLNDGSNEQFDYANEYYYSVNPPLNPNEPGNPELDNLNRWQALGLDTYVDQAGNPIVGAVPFLSPEWGNVWPFAMTDEHKNVYERDGATWNVFQDPGSPPYIQAEKDEEGSNPYKFGHELVAIWSSHLDPTDGVMWDISPGASGNLNELPATPADYPNMYDLVNGGDGSTGRAVNPFTGEPYPENMVPRGDYTRVLAEFWADGPDSETPPGHWFVIMNHVFDDPDFERKFEGQGAEMDELEYDVKAYFLLGGTMHDAAVSAWSVKGYYDYIRPISAIRGMAELGQSSDPNLPNYHEDGLVLKEGLVELVMPGDPLEDEGTDTYKIKLFAWRGPDFIENPETDEAGVGWILAENWWPYQRPTFVTPPFAGYVSGHSTYSRAAAEVLTLLTGSEYFPGGVGEFEAPKNRFLVFEEGPSIDVTLQWATYRDASDQTSLSRIWGGIHPPADDVPGRKMGIEIGHRAFAYAKAHFDGSVITSIPDEEVFAKLKFGPNPVQSGEPITISLNGLQLKSAKTMSLSGELLGEGFTLKDQQAEISTHNLKQGIYLLNLQGKDWQSTLKVWVKE